MRMMEKHFVSNRYANYTDVKILISHDFFYPCQIYEILILYFLIRYESVWRVTPSSSAAL